MTKEFKKQLNYAELYFEIFYVVYIGILIFQGQMQAALVVFVFGLAIFSFLLGFRPYKYSITRKTLTLHRRLGKNREINLMYVETLCDPIPKLTKLVTNERSLEMYIEGQKRLVVTPQNQALFVQEVLVANKRIHVQVSEYAKNKGMYEKERRKALKKEARLENKIKVDSVSRMEDK